MDRQNLSATLVKEARCLTEQIAEAEIEKKLMSNLLADIIKREQGQCSEAVKRKRRCANEIIVKFACKHQSCNKLYSSETSLAKHIKLKHSCVKVDPP